MFEKAPVPLRVQGQRPARQRRLSAACEYGLEPFYRRLSAFIGGYKYAIF